MSSTVEGNERPILLNAVRTLVADAQSERATLPVDASERQFYLGVEAAAQEVLHPELARSRGPDWLDREPLEFREGYQRTTTMLLAARTHGNPPVRFHLPSA